MNIKPKNISRKYLVAMFHVEHEYKCKINNILTKYKLKLRLFR